MKILGVLICLIFYSVPIPNLSAGPLQAPKFPNEKKKNSNRFGRIFTFLVGDICKPNLHLTMLLALGGIVRSQTTKLFESY